VTQNLQILHKLQTIKEMLECGNQQETPSVPAHHMINGQNVTLWPTRDGGIFCLDLMTALS